MSDSGASDQATTATQSTEQQAAVASGDAPAGDAPTTTTTTGDSAPAPAPAAAAAPPAEEAPAATPLVPNASGKRTEDFMKGGACCCAPLATILCTARRTARSRSAHTVARQNYCALQSDRQCAAAQADQIQARRHRSLSERDRFSAQAGAFGAVLRHVCLSNRCALVSQHTNSPRFFSRLAFS